MHKSTEACLMRNFFCHHLFYFVYYKTISYKSWTHIIVKGMESMLLLLRWKDQTIMIRNSWEAPTTRFISKWRPRVFWLCNLLSQCSKYYILCMTSKCHCFIKIHTETVLSPDHFFSCLEEISIYMKYIRSVGTIHICRQFNHTVKSYLIILICLHFQKLEI